VSAVVLTEVVCDGFSPPSTRPRLISGSFDVMPLSPTASTDFIRSMCFGHSVHGPDEFFKEARNMGRSLVSTPSWQSRFILVVETLDDIANLCDARSLR